MTHEKLQSTDSTRPADDCGDAPVTAAAAPASSLTIQLSRKLLDRLTHTSRDEGISVESLVQELLAEAVTLRAWEIIERKSAMRGESAGGGGRSFSQGGNAPGHRAHGQSHGQGPKGGHPNSNNHRPSGGGSGGGGRGRMGNAWMEDKAAFLEYVRNQEKRGR
jgi:hypothetical protein